MATAISFAQSEPAILDNEFQIKKSTRSPIIKYEKFGEGGFMRFEKNKVQYFDKEFEKKWEKYLPKLVSEKGEYHFVDGDNEYVYVLYYSVDHYSAGKGIRTISRIDINGDIINKNLSSEMSFYSVDAFELTEDGLFVAFSSGDVREGKSVEGLMVNPFTSTLDRDNYKYYTSYALLDDNLEYIIEPSNLESNLEDSKINPIWVYQGCNQGSFEFNCKFFMDKDGKVVDTYKGATIKQKIISIDRNGKMSDIIEDGEPFLGSMDLKYNYPIKYNNIEYHLTLANSVIHNISRRASAMIGVQRIKIEKGDKALEFTDPFMKSTVNGKSFFTNKVDKNSKIKFIDLVEDPINGGLTMIVADGLMHYFIQISSNLELLSIDKLIMMTNTYYYIKGNKNFACPFEAYRGSTLVKKSSFKGNAFSKMGQVLNSSLVTILNFENYQLLISDDLKKKNTKVFKVD
jgi:hypothetical protein